MNNQTIHKIFILISIGIGIEDVVQIQTEVFHA